MPRSLTVGPHVFVPPWDGATVTVGGDDGRHLARVLRVRVGEPVSLADGTGRIAQTTVTDIDGAAVNVRVDAVHDVPVSTPTITVVQALPKGKKMDQVVQRLSEVDVDRLIPVVTARTIREMNDQKASKAAIRWVAVAAAAARQSRRPRTMQIDPITVWPPRLDGVLVVLDEDATTPLVQVIDDAPPSEHVTLAIGPEGGWARDEIAGFTTAALGPTILRTETAGIVAATLAAHATGRWASETRSVSE